MKRLVVFLTIVVLFPVPTFATTETKFPTAYDNPSTAGNDAFANPGNAIDGTDLHTTSGNEIGDGLGTTLTASIDYKTWQTTTHTYSSLLLIVDSDASLVVKGGIGGAANSIAELSYSLDGGSTWSDIRAIFKASSSTTVLTASWGRVTDQVVIPPTQNLSLIRVRMILTTSWTQGSGPGQSSVSGDLWSISTLGTISTPGRSQGVIVGK